MGSNKLKALIALDMAKIHGRRHKDRTTLGSCPLTLSLSQCLSADNISSSATIQLQPVM